MRYLDTLVKEHLEDRFGKQDLSYVETGFGSILRWKRVMSFAKVDLLKHGLVVQVKGMAVHMQYSKHLDLKRLAQKKINYHLLVQTMPPKIVKTIRGKALTYKVRV